MKSSTKFIIGFMLLLALMIFVVRLTTSSGPTIYDGFAQCLADSGVVMYGAYWCPHCKEQKEMFDNSEHIPYIECDPRGDNADPSACELENIEGYPTWIFADGERRSGTLPLSELAFRTGCELPA